MFTVKSKTAATRAEHGARLLWELHVLHRMEVEAPSTAIGSLQSDNFPTLMLFSYICHRQVLARCSGLQTKHVAQEEDSHLQPIHWVVQKCQGRHFPRQNHMQKLLVAGRTP